jgi:hypothetical protein
MLELIGFLVVLFFAAIIAAYIVGLILLSPMFIAVAAIWTCERISEGLAKLEASMPARVWEFVFPVAVCVAFSLAFAFAVRLGVL